MFHLKWNYIYHADLNTANDGPSLVKSEAALCVCVCVCVSVCVWERERERAAQAWDTGREVMAWAGSSGWNMDGGECTVGTNRALESLHFLYFKTSDKQIFI